MKPSKAIGAVIAGITALAFIVTLAACGSSGGGSTSVSSSASAPTAAQVASQLHATDVQAVTPPTMFAADEATATWQGKQVDIATFKTTQDRDNWIKAASEFGPIETQGPLYAVAGD